MAPNLYICARNLVCPWHWSLFRPRQRYQQEEQYWSSPVPGFYKHYPGQGWHLVRREGSDQDEKFPPALVYCRALHRYMFDHELEERSRWAVAPREAALFLLDDGVSWIAVWDANSRFIPGPYPKWWLDEDGETMHRGPTPPASAVVSRCNSIVG
ncbi:hypothetical protein N7470_003586 [Penicillium chermesinum]|nr:hypothetical protein N7470_003586 [Penicillium chermesinum]